MRAVLGFGLMVLLAGCPAEKPKPEVIDAGAPIELDAGPPVDAGPPPPSSLESTKVTAGYRDGGTAEINAKSEIEAPTSLTIALPIKLKDFRIRLLDWTEKVVTSDDELQADGRTYVINLPEPLKTGRAYNLVLDAELGPIITDDSGGTWNDWDLTFRIAGDVQPEPGAAKKKKPNKKK